MSSPKSDLSDVLHREEREVQEFALSVSELRSEVESRGEDLNSTTETLVNNLQMLKSLQVQLAFEKKRIQEIENEKKPSAEEIWDSILLKKLVEMSKKSKDEKQSLADFNGRNFETAVLSELSHVVEDIHGIKRVLEGPKEAKLEPLENEGLKTVALASLRIILSEDQNEKSYTVEDISEDDTFEDIVEKAAQYWSLNPLEFSLFDSNNVCMPSQAKVKQSMSIRDSNILHLCRSGAGGHGQEPEPKSKTNEFSKDVTFEGNGNENNDSAGGERSVERTLRIETRKMEKEKEEIEDTIDGGYRFSLRMLRNHCETFLFMLFLTVVFNYFFFSKRLYDSEPFRSSVERAFLSTPFSACSDCPSQDGFTQSVNFYEIESMAKVFDFLDGPVKSFLTVPSANTSEYDISYSKLPVLQGYNVLPTRILLEQMRVSSTCDSKRLFDLDFTSCNPTLERGTVSTESYGSMDGTVVDEAFTFTPPDPSPWPGFLLPFIGGIGDSFWISKGSFSTELSMIEGEFMEQTRLLRSGGWIDGQTRAVIVTMNLYCPNIDTFVVVIATFQFTVANGVIPTIRLLPTQLATWVLFGAISFEEYLLYLSAGLYLLFLLAFVFDFAISKDKIQFLRRPKHLVDISIMLLVFVLVSFIATQDVKTKRAADEMKENIGEVNKPYIEIRGIAMSDTVIRSLQGVLGVFLALKAIGYLSMNPQISHLSRSFRMSLVVVNNFTFVFLVFLFAFALGGHYTLGRDEFVFYSFDLALFSTCEMMLGIFSLGSLSTISATRAWPIIFGAFVFFFSYFGLYRVFIAIITYSYSRSMDEVRMKGYYWLPSVNQEYKIESSRNMKGIKKIRVATKLGMADGEILSSSLSSSK